MSNAGPVTGVERYFKPDQKLISSTDLQGNILHCNDTFVEISGFSREELIGQPHNLVRHPDMPEKAFKVMWKHLKAGKPWMGLVKNRCKNGDHYWVNAYVTPVTEQGEVIGYESVRSCPTREDVQRAERLYQDLNRNRSRYQLPTAVRNLALACVFAVPAPLIAFYLNPLLSSAWLLLALFAFGWIQFRQRQRDFLSIHTQLEGVFKDRLAVLSYTDQPECVGTLVVGVMSLKAHLDTVLTRIEDASCVVAQESSRGLELTRAALEEIQHQHQQTDLVATAMHEISMAVNEIAAKVQQTADAAEESSTLAHQGSKTAEVTRAAIENLHTRVLGISESVCRLVQHTDEITAAAMQIEEIAEQTNLLALNAAIEAARAGEHGRGFSVVADEVRQLATSTRESTRSIHRILLDLSEQASASEKVASQGTGDAEAGLDQAIRVERMFQGITGAVDQITKMANQMSSAVEQQAQVTREVNNKLLRITELANSSFQKTEDSAHSIQRSRKVSADLHELVVRFKQCGKVDCA